MLGVAKTSANLERAKLQQQIAEEARRKQPERAARQARARVWAAMADQRDRDRRKGTGNPPKKVRKDPAVARADDENKDEDDEDLEVVMERGKCKRVTKSFILTNTNYSRVQYYQSG